MNEEVYEFTGVNEAKSNIEDINEIKSNLIEENDNNSEEENDFGIEVIDNYITPSPYYSILNPEPDLSTLPPLETTPELDSECLELLNQFLLTLKPPPLNKRSLLIQYLQRQKVNSLIQLKYTETSKFQEYITKLHNSINESDQNENYFQRINLLEEKIKETQLKFEETKLENERIIEKELQNSNYKKDLLINQQNQELDSFEEQWNNEEYLRKFAKPSTNLLKLRNIEKTFVMMKDFEKAENIRKEIELLELEESNLAQQKVEEIMKKQQKKLLEKHNNENNIFEEQKKKLLEIIYKNNNLKLEFINSRKLKLNKDRKSVV